jgi:hypothetical protein
MAAEWEIKNENSGKMWVTRPNINDWKSLCQLRLNVPIERLSSLIRILEVSTGYPQSAKVNTLKLAVVTSSTPIQFIMVPNNSTVWGYTV